MPAGKIMLTGPLYSLYFPFSILACSNPLTNNLYVSPIFTSCPSLFSVMSSTFVSVFVKFSGTTFVSNICTVILSLFVNTVEVLKYLSVTENSTVNVFSS